MFLFFHYQSQVIFENLINKALCNKDWRDPHPDHHANLSQVDTKRPRLLLRDTRWQIQVFVFF
jgi:hypothetical protein